MFLRLLNVFSLTIAQMFCTMELRDVRSTRRATTEKAISLEPGSVGQTHAARLAPYQLTF